jgi:ATP-dependent DNA ligase
VRWLEAHLAFASEYNVARAKKVFLHKKRTLGSGSPERAVRRQPFDVYDVSRRIPTAPLPGFVAPLQAMLVDSIRPGDWIYEIKFDGYRAVAHRIRRLSQSASIKQWRQRCWLHFAIF